MSDKVNSLISQSSSHSSLSSKDRSNPSEVTTTCSTGLAWSSGRLARVGAISDQCFARGSEGREMGQMQEVVD